MKVYMANLISLGHLIWSPNDMKHSTNLIATKICINTSKWVFLKELIKQAFKAPDLNR